MGELRGKAVADALTEQLALRSAALREQGTEPTLLIVRVGERPDDLSYQRGAVSRCEKTGIRPLVCAFPADVTEEDFLRGFEKTAKDPAVHGILLLHPLPPHISMDRVKAVFPPEKDVDCMLDENLGRIFLGDKTVSAPCTAQAVMELLKFYGVPLAGKHAVICGRSMVVGKPLSQLMLNQNATVTVCHSRTADMPSVTRAADIVVTAVGRARMFTAEYFSPGQTVVDVGINTDETGKLCGDVDFDAVSGIVEGITPVPGGVGAVTTAVLAQNCIASAENRK